MSRSITRIHLGQLNACHYDAGAAQTYLVLATECSPLRGGEKEEIDVRINAVALGESTPRTLTPIEAPGKVLKKHPVSHPACEESISDSAWK